MRFLKYWDIINNSVRVSKREEGKKRIGTTEQSRSDCEVTNEVCNE